jgi:Hg(II)-responsive transcriptional regulator
MGGLRTGEVAKQAEVNLETIRFYERKGLLPKPPRTASGYRTFSPEMVRRVRFIKRAQDLGFSLKEIKELLALRLDPDTTCAEVRARAEEKVADIQQKVHDLHRMKKTLKQLVATCPGRGAISTCPILESLDTSNSARSTRVSRTNARAMPSA